MTERCSTAYHGVRERVAEIVGSLDPGTDVAPAPATPAWTVHDLLAHLVGVARDVVEGRLDGVTTEAWTAAQVDRRRDVPTAALLAEWDEFGAHFESELVAIPEHVAGQAVLDAVTHEHDLRHATGQGGARTSDATTVAFDWACATRTHLRAPALRFRTDAGERVSGAGEPVATVTASRFELLRAFTGRRTEAEVRAFGWDAPDVRPALLLLAPIFTFRSASLQER
jgi:uncharacterized protein (TIGR03083 family)